MKANIKYNYIPKGKITISTLTQMFELTEEEIYNIGIIDNASKGVRLYSDEISKYAYLCKASDLVSQINSLIKKQVCVMIINNYNLDLDIIRKDLLPLSKKYNVTFIINEELSSNIKNRVSMNIISLLDCKDEVWSQNKESILDEMNKVVDRQKEYSNTIILNENGDYDMDSVFELMNITRNNFEDQYDEPYDRFEYEEIKEEYSYTINNESLKVSLTADNEIIINDGEESVKINNSQFDFLFNTLSKLLNI